MLIFDRMIQFIAQRERRIKRSFCRAPIRVTRFSFLVRNEENDGPSYRSVNDPRSRKGLTRQMNDFVCELVEFEKIKFILLMTKREQNENSNFSKGRIS